MATAPMITIKDVARLADVGVGTVSRVLSGNGSVSDETALRVRAAVARLGYRPSSIARALALRRSGAIGVYIPVFDGSYYSGLMASIYTQLRANGRHMIAANGCGDGEPRQRELDGIEFLLRCDCDGLLVASHSLRSADFQALIKRFPNTVIINRSLPRQADHCFTADHVQGGRLAALALVEAGHRSIATVSGPNDSPDNLDRMAGFNAELARHRIHVAPAHAIEATFRHDGGDAAARRLIGDGHGAGQRPLAFTAVFCANDVMAMAVVSRLTQAGFSVPADVSVIGYDDADFAPYMAPPLTTVHIPTASIAGNATRHVLNLCYGMDLPVERESTLSIAWRQSVGTGPHPRSS